MCLEFKERRAEGEEKVNLLFKILHFSINSSVSDRNSSYGLYISLGGFYLKLLQASNHAKQPAMLE